MWKTGMHFLPCGVCTESDGGCMCEDQERDELDEWIADLIERGYAETTVNILPERVRLCRRCANPVPVDGTILCQTCQHNLDKLTELLAAG